MGKQLGIGLLFSKEVSCQIIELSKELSSIYNVSYLIDGYKFYPHLTLYQSKFPSNLQIKELFGRFDPALQGRDIQVEFDNIGFFSGAFVFYDCKKTDGLQTLHEGVVEHFKKYRSNDPAIGKEQSLSGLTEPEIKNLDEYGYQFVKEAFRPHFTIGRVIDKIPDEEKIKGKLKMAHNLDNKVTYPEKLVVYKIGIDGSCAEILQTKRL